MAVIGFSTILFTAIRISAQFYLMLSDQEVMWSYCLVNLLLLTPQYFAATYFVVWFNKETITSRGDLGRACTLVAVSSSLLAVWYLIYFM
jgi:hypothetical protein